MKIVLTPQDVHNAIATMLNKDPATFSLTHQDVRKGDEIGIHFTVDDSISYDEGQRIARENAEARSKQMSESRKKNKEAKEGNVTSFGADSDSTDTDDDMFND